MFTAQMPRKYSPQEKEDMQNQFDKKLGRQLKKNREKKGIKVIEMSDALDIPANYIIRIEEGKIRLSAWMLKQILTFLGVPKWTIIKKDSVNKKR